MMARLKRHKAGARLTLRDDELLHVSIMPSSLNVHTVRVIISDDGEFEFGEWVTGEDGKYTYKAGNLEGKEVDALKESLTDLHTVEQSINFDEIEFDYNEYEGTERKVLRFWIDHVERELFLPTSSFYSHYNISEEIKTRYELAFDSVCEKLPLEWIG